MTKYIVVSGGVISGVGKGVTTASLGKILQEHGYATTLIKIDPYINFDAGTLRPTEHGEVWVTYDGGEIDQDLGTYERFMGKSMPKKNNITTGQIYKAVIDRERRGEYLGQTVQFIPHIPDEIIKRIKEASLGYEIVIIEVGGTVGDYENTPFLVALKALEQEISRENIAYVLVSYLPVPHHIFEMKTKPTQQAIRLLNEAGIFPDFIVCRAAQEVDEIRRKKIQQYANIRTDHVISAPDITNIYQVPLNFEKEHLGEKMLKRLELVSRKKPDWSVWEKAVTVMINPLIKIKIAIIGKYVSVGDYSLADSYVSIYQALLHAGAPINAGIDITWIDSAQFEDNPESCSLLNEFAGIIIPGGFGSSGVEGKIAAISYARIHNIPYLGLCYGMQLAVVEFARNVCKMEGAHTTEVNQLTAYPVIDILAYQKEILENHEYGASMRLGDYPAQLIRGTRVYDLYASAFMVDKYDQVSERHRHRYEVNPAYVDRISSKGLTFSGYYEREDGTRLMEYIELPYHPFFIATQAHPEFTSRLEKANPLFKGFVQAASEHQVWQTKCLSVQVMHEHQKEL